LRLILSIGLSHAVPYGSFHGDVTSGKSHPSIRLWYPHVGMDYKLRLISLILVAFACPLNGFPDSLMVDFLSPTGSDSQYPAGTVVGVLTLALLPDGEISADLTSIAPMFAFGFNGPPHTALHDFSPIQPEGTTGGVGSELGVYSNAFVCFSEPTVCGLEENFLIGDPQQFTSVYDIVGLDTIPADSPKSHTNFLLALEPGGNANTFLADAPTPELSTFVMLASVATVLMGRFGWRRIYSKS
jgi:hypothetical protein